ncbi:MAG: hypothetical protein ACW98I_12155 [Candidatus Hodarchaeales archaeon]
MEPFLDIFYILSNSFEKATLLEERFRADEQYIIVQPKNDLVIVFTANESTINVIAVFNSFIQNSVLEDVSVTCPTTVATTTSTIASHTTTITNTTVVTTTTTTSGASGFDILIILGMLIMGSIFERRKRRE